MKHSLLKGKFFKQPIVYVIFGLLCAVLVSTFYFTQDSTKKTSKAPERLIEPSAACTPNEIKDSDQLSADRSVGTRMDEDEAMAFLFADYDPNEKIASWCPDKDSETIQYLYNKRSLSELKTKLVFSARYQENGHPHFFVIIQTERYFDSCHACTVVLGGAIFHQVNGLWTLKALNRSIAAAGSWGRADRNMSLAEIGPDLHAVVVRDGHMAQGEYIENFHIIGPAGDRVERLFFLFDAASDNEGCRERAGQDPDGGHQCYAYDSTTTFRRGSNANYFDIQIIRKGTNYDDDGSVKPFKEVFLYRFNGCSYVKGPVGNFSGDRPFYIQLAAFAKYQSAKDLAKKLSKIGYPTYCDFHKPNKDNSFFRVRIGNYGSPAEADRILTKIRKLGYDGFISQK